jgi:2-dehydro-3-deoxy-D-arabinonate dehydratase
MAPALFRVRLADGSVRLARGESLTGPTVALDPALRLAELLRAGPRPLRHAATSMTGDPLPAGCEILAPIEDQEVWAAGVTYATSRTARMAESESMDVYAKVWEAERPELFYKAQGWRTVGPGGAIGVRADSSWDVPEPELALCLTPDMAIAAYTIGNDVSSRAIEGANPLYLPQAKSYDRACALGPCLVAADAVTTPFEIALEIERDGQRIERLSASTADMRRTFTELAGYLGRAQTFPDGVFLMTGTSLVPEPPFTLRPGDLVHIEIAGLGRLSNPVIEVGRVEDPPRTER